MIERVYCTDCKTGITLNRGNNGQLRLRCDCNSIPTKVSEALPEGWQR